MSRCNGQQASKLKKKRGRKSIRARSLYKVNNLKNNNILFYFIFSYHFCMTTHMIFSIDEINDIKRIRVKYFTFSNMQMDAFDCNIKSIMI